MLSDTSPEAERVQIELLRRASTAQRVARCRSLSTMTMELARRAIRRQHPDWDDREVQLHFVALHYGEDLASRVRSYLESREA